MPNSNVNDTNQTKAVTDLGKRLLEAARLGNSEEVANLMKNGAPLTTDWLGTTPLHLASIYGHTETAEVLIKSGISRDGRTKVDKVPLHFACQHGHIDIVKLLVNGGAHINAADMLKMTPLHWAVECNSFEICLLLLNAGVKTNMKNKFHKTALEIAEIKGFTSIVQLLSDEKFKGLNQTDQVPQSNIKDDRVNSVKICPPKNFFTSPISPAVVLKKQKTRRFPMVAGTWTGGEALNQDRFEISQRKVFRRKLQEKEMETLKTLTRKSDSSPNTPDKNEILIDSSPIYDYGNGSPLQKLQDTVLRQSKELGETELTKVTTQVTTPVTTHIVTPVITTKPEKKADKAVPIISLTYPASKESQLHQGVPVISSDQLKNLPANIQALPVTQDSENRSTTLIDSVVKPTITNNTLRTAIIDKNIEHTPNKKQNEQLTNPFSKSPVAGPTLNNSSSSIPIDIPYNLLNQIVSGNISLQSRPGLPDSDLIGINTEMGTIPVVPVSGKGGLQLVPLDETPSSTTQSAGLKLPEAKLSASNATQIGFPLIQNVGNTNSVIQTPSGAVILQPQPNSFSLNPIISNGMIVPQANAFTNINSLIGNPHLTKQQNIGTSPLIMSPSVFIQPTHSLHPALNPTYFQTPTIVPTAIIHPSMMPQVAHPQTILQSCFPQTIYQGQPMVLQASAFGANQLQPQLFYNQNAIPENFKTVEGTTTSKEQATPNEK